MTYFPPGGANQPQGMGYQGPGPGFGLMPSPKLRPGRIWYLATRA